MYCLNDKTKKVKYQQADHDVEDAGDEIGCSEDDDSDNDKGKLSAIMTKGNCQML